MGLVDERALFPNLPNMNYLHDLPTHSRLHYMSLGWKQGARACVATGSRDLSGKLRVGDDRCREHLESALSDSFDDYEHTIHKGWRNHAYQTGYRAAKEKCREVLRDVPRSSKICNAQFFCCPKYRPNGKRCYGHHFSSLYSTSFITANGGGKFCKTGGGHNKCDCDAKDQVGRTKVRD